MFFFFLQAEDGIRDAQESRGLGDVYKRQDHHLVGPVTDAGIVGCGIAADGAVVDGHVHSRGVCLLYTSDAADELLCVDLGGRRITKKKNK